MVAELNRLAELVELDSLPPWLREQIASKREEIQQKLQADGYFVFEGPEGEQVRITVKRKVAAA